MTTIISFCKFVLSICHVLFKNGHALYMYSILFVLQLYNMYRINTFPFAVQNTTVYITICIIPANKKSVSTQTLVTINNTLSEDTTYGIHLLLEFFLFYDKIISCIADKFPIKVRNHNVRNLVWKIKWSEY